MFEDDDDFEIDAVCIFQVFLERPVKIMSAPV